nr:type I polyketide synthase [Anaeromyxobacter dehalogenans]
MTTSEQRGTPRVPIALIGVGCVLPGAGSVEAFWDAMQAGRDAFEPLAGGAWDWERLGLGRLPAAAQVTGFRPDWRAFRMPPADADAMNPAQLQVLEAGRQALAAVKALPRERTGVWLGATGLGWRPDTGLRVRLDALASAVREAAGEAGVPVAAAEAALASARASLEARLRPASEEPVVNSAGSIAAGRVGMLLDLRGPHAAVDAGFASGLAALDVAARALRDGTVDCALFGAASELLSPAELVALSRMGVLSAGRPRPFDAAADGTLPGEGAVMFAAKRLDDALRDGDRILAVVLGVAGACDGAAASPLAPRPDGLALAIRRAHEEGAVDPATVGFVECHATGTPRGDASELAALAQGYRGVPGPVAIGSAKAQVGHLRGASAAVGMLRTVLALQHGVVPPQAGFSRPHPDLRLEETAFEVPRAPAPLRPRAGCDAARAAVSAVSLGGLAYHAVLAAPSPAPAAAGAWRAPAEAAPLAVIGLGAMLPGAEDVPAFWRALQDGRSSIRDVPASRWDASRYCHPDAARLERSYTRLGGFTDAPALADARWRIPPAAREAVDPAHLLALRVAEEAVADAGLERGAWDRGRTGVFLGFMACQGRKLLAEVRFHLARLAAEVEAAAPAAGLTGAQARALLDAARARVEGELPPLAEDSLPGWLGSVMAARIARRFDLRGPQLTVESACASTLAALQAAVQALRDGTCDTALVGGVWADMQPEFYVGCCRFNALSATGSTPFDARADGFVPGEGAGVLVLRRLADAERDGQRVHALVRAVGASSDGKGKSVFAPSLEGEALAMRRALEAGGIDPALVDYVECHGTGTALGDRTEVEACVRAYGRGRARPLRIGSVKSNIGHLLGAAGAPALLKAVLAVREGLLPPSLEVERPNPAIDFGAGPVEVVTRAERWTAPDGAPRRAGVSGFGLGGTNVHALVEEYRPAAPARVAPVVQPPPVQKAAPAPALAASSLAARPLAIAAAGAEDAAGCAEALERLASALRDAGPEDYLAALRASRRAAAEAPFRAAVVAADPAALAARAAHLSRAVRVGLDLGLLRAQGVHAADARKPAQVAVTFPGQGPQYPNMLRDALAAFPSLGRTLDDADRAYQALCGRPLRPSFFTDRPDAYAQSDEDIHCAVFVVNVALHRLLVRHGLAPRALMGQSAGELAALVAAGAMSLEDGLAVVRERTLSVLALTRDDPGQMVALTCGAERAARFTAGLPGYAALAADNGPGACIVSCDRRAMPELLRRASDEGVEATVLAVSHGYHSQLIAAAQPRYLRLLRTIPFRAPEVEIVSTVTGRSLAEVSPERFPEHLASQFVEPVRLRPAVDALHARGVRLFVECGPKWPLTTFVGQILGDRPHVAHATLHPKVGEVEQLQRALACLFVHGAGVLEEDTAMSTPSRSIPEIRSAPQGAGAAPSPEAMPAYVATLLRGIRDLIDGVLTGTVPEQPALAASVAVAAPAPAPVAAPAGQEPVAVAQAVAAPEPAPAPATAPVAAPAAEPVAAAAPAVGADEVRRALVAEYARRTGYPEEMLDPELDLEAELGIDTVKQVAVLAAVRERLGVPPDPAFKLRDANTIAKATAWLASRVHVAPVVAPVAPTAAPTVAPPPPKVVAAPAPAVSSAPPPPPPNALGRAAPRLTLEAAREQVGAAIVEELVKRTGYPAEMLDADLDLEAELGIDTVKQVAVLAAARERFGLPPDPGFKLRDANTIRKAADALARRLAPADPDGPGGGPRPPGGGAPRPTATPLAVAPHAAAAVATPVVNDARGPAVAASRRLLEALLGAAGEGVREVAHLELRASGEAAPAREPLVDVAHASDGALRLRAILGESEAEATVRVGAPGPAAAAPAEILRAIAPERRGRAASGAELRDALAPVLGAADGVLAWARSDGFMVAAGGADAGDGDEVERLAAALAAASELASFAWLGVTGAPHAVCSVEKVRVHAAPAAGDAFGIHVKMVAPEGGLWRADVTVVAGDALVAELRGVCGRTVATGAAAGPIGEAAERAWRRYSRRVRDGRASEGVA